MMSLSRCLRALAPLATALLLTACYNATSGDQTKPISFSKYQPFNMAIGKVEVVDEYKSPGRKPNVEQTFSNSPAKAMHIWVKDRIRTTGGDRRLVVIIKDASVVETDLPRTTGFRGAFTTDQAWRYDARMEVEMRMYGPADRLSDAAISAKATRSMTLAEDVTPAERQRAYNAMVLTMMEALNAELEKNMHMYFNNYIDYSTL